MHSSEMEKATQAPSQWSPLVINQGSFSQSLALPSVPLTPLERSLSQSTRFPSRHLSSHEAFWSTNNLLG